MTNLRNRRHYQRLHASSGIIAVLFRETRIYDVLYPVYCERGLGYVSG